MCEYCLDKEIYRNTYNLRGSTEKHAKVILSLEGEEGLKIIATWIDEHTNEKFGLAAEAIVRYCPWCGRKLKSTI